VDDLPARLRRSSSIWLSDAAAACAEEETTGGAGFGGGFGADPMAVNFFKEKCTLAMGGS